MSYSRNDDFTTSHGQPPPQHVGQGCLVSPSTSIVGGGSGGQGSPMLSSSSVSTPGTGDGEASS